MAFGFQYSSRDEGSNTSLEAGQTSRFGLLVSPSTYRPSYSGGTYRSIGIKKTTQSTPSRWLAPSKTDCSITSSEASIKRNVPSNSEIDSKSTANESSNTTTSRASTNIAKISSTPSPSKPIYTSNYISSPSSLANKIYPKFPNKIQMNSVASKSLHTNNSQVLSYKNKSARDKKSSESSTEFLLAKEISPTAASMNNTDSSTSDSNEEQQHCDEMIEVTVCTRGTSPNFCSSTNFSRCRRAEIAKTIEKVILRQKHKAIGEDKGIQSEQMDDIPKYRCFSSSRASTPWQSYLDPKYNSSYSRYNSNPSSISSYSSSKYTSLNKNNSNEKNSSEPHTAICRNIDKITSDKYKETALKYRDNSVSKSPSVSRSSSVSVHSKSKSDSSKSKSKSPPDILQRNSSSSSSSVSPPKQRTLNDKILTSTAPLKSDSPSKMISVAASSLTANPNGKWANKDFRKSALNMGPSDRPRKHHHNLSNLNTVDKEKYRKIPQKQSKIQISSQRTERSPSVSSETNYSSSSYADDVAKNSIKLKISAAPVNMHQDKSMTNELIHTNDESIAFNCNCELMPNPVLEFQNNDSCANAVHNNDDNNNNNSKEAIISQAFNSITKHFNVECHQNLNITNNSNNNNETSKININKKLNEDILNDCETTISISNGSRYSADESSWINSLIITNEQLADKKFENLLNTDNNINNEIMRKKCSEQQSAELTLWLNETSENNDDTEAEDITLNQSDNDKTDNLEMERTFPWWISADEKTTSTTSDGMRYRITHIQSGERAWWLDEDTEESVNDILEAAVSNENISTSNFSVRNNTESNDQTLWLYPDNDNNNNNQACEDVVKSENKIELDEDGQEIDFWATINETSATNNNSKNRVHASGSISNNCTQDINANCISLEHRVSPEGVENFGDSSKLEKHLSVYDNDDTADVERIFGDLFISRHKNIDDILGRACHAFNTTTLDPGTENQKNQQISIENDNNMITTHHTEAER